MTSQACLKSARRRRAGKHAAIARLSARTRRGVLLVIVLLVIALLSLAGYSYSEYMFSEYRGTRVNARLIQARLFAESGVDSIKAFLLNDEATRNQSGGVYENTPLFQAVLVQDADSDRMRGRFTVVAPLIDDDGARAGIRFGLEDESTRLNINALPALEGIGKQMAEANALLTGQEASANPGRDLLMALPGMTEDTADAILDWIDADDEPREFGCEAEEYAGRSPPYKPRNGPLMSVEELLLVRGVTPQLLFGADVNRNGIIDPSEASMAQGGNEQGSLDAGWAGYLTLYSAEKNVRADGTPRIDLNQEDLSKLSDELSDVFTAEQVSFIIAYRQNKPYTGTTASSGGSAPAPDLSQPAIVQFSQVLDLVGAKVQVLNPDETRSVIDSPFKNDPIAMAVYLPTLMDNCTVNSAPVIPGRININQAPRAILAGIPDMTDDIVEAILSSRTPTTTDNINHRSETWLLSEGICTLDEMKKFMPYMTGGGSVFHAQVVGYFDQDGPSARLETVIDATSATPRIVFWRDITNLGPGYPTAELGIETRN